MSTSAKWLFKVTFVLATVGFLLYQSAWSSRQARAMLPRLIGELQQIPSPEGARVIQEHKSSSVMALAGRSYSSPLTWQALQDYYDQRLAQLGWAPFETKPLRSWGRNFGGAIKRYQKNGLIASLEYAGIHPGHVWDYAIDISWNPNETY